MLNSTTSPALTYKTTDSGLSSSPAACMRTSTPPLTPSAQALGAFFLHFVLFFLLTLKLLK